MTIKAQLEEVEALAQRMGIKVSYDAMSGLVQGIGGLCRVRGALRIIIDRRLKPPERLQIIVDALARLELPEGTKLSDALRRRFENATPEASSPSDGHALA